MLVEALSVLPSGAKLFSSHTATWSIPIFTNLMETYPTLDWDKGFEHLDIRGFAKNVGMGKLPTPSMTLSEYCTANLGSRLSLFEVANSFGVKDKLTVPAPESKAMAIGKLIDVLYNKEIKIPK
jgi:hypothetical protein